MLFFYQEIVEVFLLRKFVTETDTVIIDTETNEDFSSTFLLEGNSQLVVVIANGSGLSPNRFPRFVESRRLGIFDGKAVHQVCFVHTTTGMLVLGQFKTQMGRFYDCLAFISHLILWTGAVHSECQGNVTIWRTNRLRSSAAK